MHYLEWIMSTVTSKRKNNGNAWVGESGRGRQQELLLWRACGVHAVLLGGEPGASWVGKGCLLSSGWNCTSNKLCSLCSLCLDLLTAVDSKKTPTNKQKNNRKKKQKTHKQKTQQSTGDFLPFGFSARWLLQTFPLVGTLDRIYVIIGNFFFLYQFCPLNCVLKYTAVFQSSSPVKSLNKNVVETWEWLSCWNTSWIYWFCGITKPEYFSHLFHIKYSRNT